MNSQPSEISSAGAGGDRNERDVQPTGAPEEYLEVGPGGLLDSSELLRNFRNIPREPESAEDRGGVPAGRAERESDGPPPLRIGDYRILRELGRGGMGIVYEAWQESLDRRVALKVLPAGCLAEPKLVARFRREAQVAAKLDHENIVKVYGTGLESGTPYFAMEFVEGRTIRQIRLSDRLGGRTSDIDSLADTETQSHPWSSAEFLEEPSPGGPDTPFTPPEVRMDSSSEAPGLAAPAENESEAQTTSGLDSATGERDPAAYRRIAGAFAGVAEGLHHAHGMGVVHRDLKPSNLILDRAGRLRILDFGLAFVEGQEHLTLSKECVGTPLYMSPEQARVSAEPLGPATDIYSLGVTLYEVLTKRPPYDGKNNHVILGQILHRDPPLLRGFDRRIPRDLETIVLKCLQKDPRERYGTAEALAQDLRRFVRGEPIEARAQPFCERLIRRAWRNRAKVAAAAVILILLISSSWLILSRRHVARMRSLEQYEPMVLAAAMKMQRGLVGRTVGAGGSEGGRYLDGFFMPDVMLFASRGDFLDLLRRTATPFPAQFSTSAENPLEEAVRELEEAAAILPGKPDAYYHRAWGLLLLAREDEALKELDQALGCDPHFVPARILRALLLERQGDLEGSKAEIELAEESSTGGWAKTWLAAHRATVEGRWREAADAYGQLIRKEASAGEPYLGSSIETFLGRGVARLELNDFAGAIEDFASARGRWLGSLEPVLLLGKTYLLKGEERQAERTFRELYSQASSKDRVALGVAVVYGALAMNESGLEWAELLQDDRIRERTRAAFLVKLSRWDEARRAGEEAIRLDPQDGAAHLSLAVALLAAGAESAEGIAALREAIQLSPGQAIAHVWLGDALARAGQLEDAFQEYDRASRLDPLNPWTYVSRGVTRERLGHPREALAEYRRAFEIDPNLSAIYLHLDDLLRWEEGGRPDFGGELQRFVAVLEKVLNEAENHPLLPDLLRILSRMLLQAPENGDLDKALRYAELAVRMTRRKDPEMLALLAQAQFTGGQGAEAVRTQEEALEFPHAGRLLLEDLERYREKIFPDLVSYASIDAALASLDTDILVPEGEMWRYFRGRGEPSRGPEWTSVDFDDASWEIGRSGFGFGDGDDATVLRDMKGSYTTVYIRRVFQVPDPRSIRRLMLSVRVDDGCVAYLNGTEVARIGIGSREGPVPHDAVAGVVVESEPLLPHDIWLDPDLLRPGGNVLALQGLNVGVDSSDLSLIPVLKATVPRDGERDRELLEEFRAAAAGEARERLLYLEARILERSARYLEAAATFDELVLLDRTRPEPFLHLARSLRSAGRVEEASKRLRRVLEEGLLDDPAIWDLWIRLCMVDLQRTPTEMLEGFPLTSAEPRAREAGGCVYAADLRWVLDRLEKRQPIRINCGGLEYRDRRGKVWGRDRFFQGGYIFGGRLWDLISSDQRSSFGEDIADTRDDILFQTERWFPAEESREVNYRIPLPPGSYVVTLHFAEIFFRELDRRSFDILIEGDAVLESYEPREAGFATADHRSFTTDVGDGFLDIELRPRKEHPKIAAIAIRPDRVVESEP